MPRKKITKKKEILVDPVYNSSILAKLITKVMYSGKKNTGPADRLRGHGHHPGKD